MKDNLRIREAYVSNPRFPLLFIPPTFRASSHQIPFAIHLSHLLLLDGT